MKIKLNIFILLLLLPLSLYSHSLLLNIMDNEDGTIMISGAFNTGESAAGALVKVQAIESEEILFQKRLTNSDELNIKIPNVPYQIVLDGGEGHVVVKDGIAPKGGFILKKSNSTKVKEKSKSRGDKMGSISLAVTVSLIIAFLLFFATIFVSSRNTKLLINEISNSK